MTDSVSRNLNFQQQQKKVTYTNKFEEEEVTVFLKGERGTNGRPKIK
jgi:hypothetical protein